MAPFGDEEEVVIPKPVVVKTQVKKKPVSTPEFTECNYIIVVLIISLLMLTQTSM